MTKEWKAGDKLEPVSIDLTLRRAIQAVAGTRDFIPFHHDAEYARQNGAEGIFFNTMFLQGFIGRAVAEWFGNDSFPRRLEIAMHASNYVGRTLTAEGSVAEVRESNGSKLIDAKVTLATEDGPTTAIQITIQLPPTIAS